LQLPSRENRQLKATKNACALNKKIKRNSKDFQENCMYPVTAKEDFWCFILGTSLNKSRKYRVGTKKNTKSKRM
jgi:hypothetical protein